MFSLLLKKDFFLNNFFFGNGNLLANKNLKLALEPGFAAVFIKVYIYFLQIQVSSFHLFEWKIVELAVRLVIYHKTWQLQISYKLREFHSMKVVMYSNMVNYLNEE